MHLKRSQLHEVLPLDTPYSLHVFPSYFCNFSCSYCLHSLSSSDLDGMGFRKQLLSFDTYRKTLSIRRSTGWSTTPNRAAPRSGWRS
jgi:sulfatase maturation enzyme AslB (radical SAM superfamily)